MYQHLGVYRQCYVVRSAYLCVPGMFRPFPINSFPLHTIIIIILTFSHHVTYIKRYVLVPRKYLSWQNIFNKISVLNFKIDHEARYTRINLIFSFNMDFLRPHCKNFFENTKYMIRMFVSWYICLLK